MLDIVVLERMFGLFAIAQAIHIAQWRWRRPQGYLRWFVRIWVILPTLCVVAWQAGWGFYSGSVDLNDTTVWLGAFIGYGALCGAYVMIYPAISELSPSLEILRTLRGARGRELPVESFKVSAVAGVPSVAHRFNNLASAGLIAAKGDVLTTTASGLRIAKALDAFRRFLGVDRGAGG
jgi:hypothetical protein